MVANGDAQRAVRLAGAAAAVRRRMTPDSAPLDRSPLDAWLLNAWQALGNTAADAFAAGKLLSTAAALTEALQACDDACTALTPPV